MKTNNDYPLWLKIAIKLPIKFKRLLRKFILNIEYWSNKLVIEKDFIHLIEGTDTPDFNEFEKQLNKVKILYNEDDDPYIKLYETRLRLKIFVMKERDKKKKPCRKMD